VLSYTSPALKSGGFCVNLPLYAPVDTIGLNAVFISGEAGVELQVAEHTVHDFGHSKAEEISASSLSICFFIN
jgi:hypothetical protein